jgi:hypothetical protein
MYTHTHTHVFNIPFIVWMIFACQWNEHKKISCKIGRILQKIHWNPLQISKPNTLLSNCVNKFRSYKNVFYVHPIYKHVRGKLRSRLYNNIMIHIVAVTMTTYSANIRCVSCAVYGDGLPDANHFFSCPLGLLWWLIHAFTSGNFCRREVMRVALRDVRSLFILTFVTPRLRTVRYSENVAAKMDWTVFIAWVHAAGVLIQNLCTNVVKARDISRGPV